MNELFDIAGLAGRLAHHAQRAGRRPEAGTLLVEIFHRGEIARGEAQTITGLGERTARDLVGELLRDGLLGSSSEKGPVSLQFPSVSADVLFPRLFPET